MFFLLYCSFVMLYFVYFSGLSRKLSTCTCMYTAVPVRQESVRCFSTKLARQYLETGFVSTCAGLFNGYDINIIRACIVLFMKG